MVVNALNQIDSIGTARQLRVSGNVINNASINGSAAISLRGNQSQYLSGSGVFKNLDISQGGQGSVVLMNDLLLGNGGTLTSLPGSSILGLNGTESVVLTGSTAGVYTLNFEGRVQNAVIAMSGTVPQRVALLQPFFVSDSLVISSLDSMEGFGIGRQIRVFGDVFSTDDGFQSINSQIAMKGNTPTSFTTTTNGPQGALEISKTGVNDVVQFATNATFSSIDVKIGTLNLGGYTATAPVSVRGAGTLTGQGRVVGTISVDPLGTVSPGAIVGSIESGDLLLSPGSVFRVDIQDSAQPTALAFDTQLVGGSVNISNAILSIAGNVTSPGIVTLIDNDATDPVQGEFQGYPQGSQVIVSGVPFKILYNGGTGNDVVLVPFNSAPSVSADNLLISVDEGGVATNTGIFSSTTSNSSVQLAASVGTVTQDNSVGTWNWSFDSIDGPDGPILVTIIATDVNGGEATTTFVVGVENVPPMILLSGPTSVLEGSPYTLQLGAIIDPGEDTITSYKIHWGDGTVDTFSGSPEFTTATHIYADGPETQIHQVYVTDEDGNFLAGELSVEVLNVAPFVVATGDLAANEGQTKSYSFTVTDPGLDTFSNLVIYVPSLGTVSNVNFNSTTGLGSFDVTFANGPALVPITVQVKDSDGAFSNVATLSVAVANMAPVVSVSGATTVSEGNTALYSFSASDAGNDLLSLQGISAGPNASVSDIQFNASTGVGSFRVTFLDGPFTSVVQVSVSDFDGQTTTSSFSVAVLNVAPTITSLNLTRNGDICHESDLGKVMLVGSFTDPGLDNHTVTINWGDGTIVTTTVANLGRTLARNYTYSSAGNYTVTVTVTDSDGAVSAVQTRSVQIAGVKLEQGVLYIYGTDNEDEVELSFDSRNRRVKVELELNDSDDDYGCGDDDDCEIEIKRTFSTVGITRIVAFLGAGNDRYDGDCNLPISQFVDGGAGNDEISGGSVGDVLVGGSGNDRIYGFAGRDIIIGGTGCDRIYGGRGEDLIIGGSTANQHNYASLDAAFADWSTLNLTAALADLGAIADDNHRDELYGEQQTDQLFGGFSDLLRQ